ncbi:hypothetical protein UCREL1_4766 [Eutypa lata UCREL1]|uniref:Uncharacterized protein n=1 Tax=Eutypa lata (strain UCR-EL1) TaxID=1287681 RepID=M7SP84_EUTLA|nr:hypothetical protein UCREL1_4766 [Eutypa lata UCREL1]
MGNGGMREYIFEATKQEVLDSVLGSVNFMGFPAYRDGKLTKDAERIFDVTCRTQMGDFLLEGIASDAQAPHAKERGSDKTITNP